MHCRVFLLLFIFTLLQTVGCVSSSLKIIEEKYGKKDQYPYIVSIEREISIMLNETIATDDYNFICTGTMISPLWCLTAGHCIDNARPGKQLTPNLLIKTVIRYGPNRDRLTDVISVIRPDLKNNNPEQLSNIGLARTGTWVVMKEYGRITLLQVNNFIIKNLTFASYEESNTSLIENNTTLEKPLKLLDVEIVRQDRINVLTPPTECKGASCLKRSGVCPPNSGGPLLHVTGIIGVNSMSVENIMLCSTLNENGVVEMGIFSPIHPYMEWLDENVKRDRLDIIS